MMRLLSAVMILLAVPLIMCCRQTADSKGHEDQVVVSRVQEPFDIKLEGCPTCGFSWILDPFDSTALRLLGHETVPLNQNPGVVGGNALELWNFTGLRKGKFLLTFRYKRPWLEEVEKREQIWVRIR
jgi:predicted secreted protein